MPHEVIMPALGMSQDTGLIVRWLKAAGDPVKASDPLMEVETDKATMEVEAGFDGIVAELRAEAGDEVPVGEVVAVLSEDGSDIAPTPSAGNGADHDGACQGSPASVGVGDGAAAGTADGAGGPAIGKTIIMPALGMSQDSGIILRWLKAPGDPVRVSDPVMEVETDKASVEVEAGHDGFLAAIHFSEGAEVPVGKAVAIITRDKPSDVTTAPPASTASPHPQTKPEQEPLPNAPQAAPAARAAPAPRGDRILASPKAKRLARERGIDLAHLATRVGHPVHAADVEGAHEEAPSAASTVSLAAPARIEATVDSAGFAALRSWISEETGQELPTPLLWAALAAGSLRAATARQDALVVRLAAPGLQSVHGSLTDPDLARLTQLAPEAAESEPDLVLRDLTATRLTALSLSDEAQAVLTVAQGGAPPDTGFALTFAFDPAALAPDAALAFIDDLARRVEDPLRHLL